MSDGIAELHTIEAPKVMEKSTLTLEAEAFVERYDAESSEVLGFLLWLAEEVHPNVHREMTALLNKPQTYGYDSFHTWLKTWLRKYRIQRYMNVNSEPKVNNDD
ncbi:MAG: hypothetical protein ACYCOX_14570 [Acidobacteriaceae bacterium]